MKKYFILLLLLLPFILNAQNAPDYGYIGVDSTKYADNTVQTTAFTVDTANSIIVDTVTTIANDTANVLRAEFGAIPPFSSIRDTIYDYLADSNYEDSNIIDGMIKSVASDSNLLRETGNIITPKTAGRKLDLDTITGSYILVLDGSLNLENTTNSTTGIIYKESDIFIHNFKHPTGGSAIPVGYNFFAGKNAGNLTMGSGATSVVHASYNTGVGENSMLGVTNGFYNSAYGYNSGRNISSGNYNAAFGAEAASAITTGSYNMAIGTFALQTAATSSSNNFAIGYNSLKYASTVSSVISLGSSAGKLINSGSNLTSITNSILIGYDARVNDNGEENQIVIGYTGRGKGSNTATIGNTSNTNNYFYSNGSGTTETSPSSLSLINQNGTSGRVSGFVIAGEDIATNDKVIYGAKFVDADNAYAYTVVEKGGVNYIAKRNYADSSINYIDGVKKLWLDGLGVHIADTLFVGSAIGINTTTPTKKLDVNGTTILRDTLFHVMNGVTDTTIVGSSWYKVINGVNYKMYTQSDTVSEIPTQYWVGENSDTSQWTLGTNKITAKHDTAESTNIKTSSITLSDSVVTGITSGETISTKEYVDNVTNGNVEYYFTNNAHGLGGIYYNMLTEPSEESQSTLVKSSLSTGDDQPLFNWATTLASGFEELESGSYAFRFHATKTSGSKPTKIYAEFYRRVSGVEILMMTSDMSDFLTTNVAEDVYFTAYLQSDSIINITDTLIVKTYANVSATGTAVDITFYQEGAVLSKVVFSVSNSSIINTLVKRDGSHTLTADWNTGSYGIETDTLKADIIKFTSAKTYYYSINSSDFLPLDAISGILDNQTVIGLDSSHTSNENGTIFRTGINMPDGAIITNVIVYGDVATNTWEMKRQTASTGAVSSMATANINSNDNTITNSTIDNSTYTYGIETSAFSLGNAIYSAIITYTITEL